MGRTASAGSSSELQHASTSRLDTLDDPLLGRVLFLAGKPGAASGRGCRRRPSQLAVPLLPDITTVWLGLHETAHNL